MGMSSGGNDRGLMGEINVTPFVDVMLVLLVIFMVTAPMMVQMQGEEIELPQTKSKALAEQDAKQVIVDVMQDGTYFYDNKPLPKSPVEFKKTLTGLLDNAKDGTGSLEGTSFFVRAHAQADYDFVAKIINQLKQAGVPRVGLVTEAIQEK